MNQARAMSVEPPILWKCASFWAGYRDLSNVCAAEIRAMRPPQLATACARWVRVHVGPHRVDDELDALREPQHILSRQPHLLNKTGMAG